jgi:hypothetical protein
VTKGRKSKEQKLFCLKTLDSKRQNV